MEKLSLEVVHSMKDVHQRIPKELVYVWEAVGKHPLGIQSRMVFCEQVEVETAASVVVDSEGSLAEPDYCPFAVAAQAPAAVAAEAVLQIH